MKAIILIATALAGNGAATEVIGAWSIMTVIDPMTDVQRGIAMTDIKNPISMVVKCDTYGDYSVYMSFISKDYLGAGSNADRSITYRLDGAPAQSITGSYDGNTANILHINPNLDTGIFIRAVTKTKRITVQLTDFQFGTHVSVIDTFGAKEAVLRVAKQCKDNVLADHIVSEF